MKLKKLITFIGVICFAGLLGLSSAMEASAEENLNIRIVGGSLGGAVNRSYAAFAQAFMKEYSGANVDILPGGAVANPTRIQKDVTPLIIHRLRNGIFSANIHNTAPL